MSQIPPDAPYGIPEAQVTGDPYERLAASLTMKSGDHVALLLHKLAIEDYDSQETRKQCARYALNTYLALKREREHDAALAKCLTSDDFIEEPSDTASRHTKAMTRAESRQRISNLAQCYVDLRQRLDEAAARVGMLAALGENAPAALADGYLCQLKRADEAEAALREERAKNRDDPVLHSEIGLIKANHDAMRKDLARVKEDLQQFSRSALELREILHVGGTERTHDRAAALVKRLDDCESMIAKTRKLVGANENETLYFAVRARVREFGVNDTKDLERVQGLERKIEALRERVRKAIFE